MDPITIIGAIIGMLVGIASTAAVAARAHLEATKRLNVIETQVELAISHEARLRSVEQAVSVLAQRTDNHVAALQRIEGRIDALIIEVRSMHNRE